MTRPPRTRRPPPPLDAAALDALALAYVGRFQTTRGRLAAYLARKVRERGWEGPAADVAAIAEKLAGYGYVDDRAWAAAKGAALARRGYGARRVGQALRAAQVGTADAQAALDEAPDPLASALVLARRKRIGPFARTVADAPTRARQLAAMLRAGHDHALARRIVAAAPGEAMEPDD